MQASGDGVMGAPSERLMPSGSDRLMDALSERLMPSGSDRLLDVPSELRCPSVSRGARVISVVLSNRIVPLWGETIGTEKR